MEEPSPLVLRDGPVLHLILNSPERLNSISASQHEALGTALRAAEADPEIRVIALSGNGRAFCSGEFLQGGDAGPARLAHRRVALDIGGGPILLNETTSAFRNSPKPTVALLHGHTLGAGYDYASSCDFRLSTRGARIGDPRINLALWGAEGWSYKLPRLVGQSHVAPMAYLGDILSGERAAEIGFVHRLYDGDGSPRDAAQGFLLRLAAIDGETYRRIKAELLANLDRTYLQATFD
jgi:enoyl-CoA hydratase/carnithine racemase